MMKVAIIHYWLVGMRGGEKVVESLCEMYPQADIFTHVYVPEMVSDRIRRHRVIPSFIQSLPRAPKMYKTYLPLMPLALEQLDLATPGQISSILAVESPELRNHNGRHVGDIRAAFQL